MNEKYLENDGLELLDALEIGFDLSDYDLDDIVVDDHNVASN